MAASGYSSSMLYRFAQNLVEETLTDTPITVLQGARQVGKSTLVRAVVADTGATVLSLDAAAAYNAARADPAASSSPGRPTCSSCPEPRRVWPGGPRLWCCMG